MAWTVTGFIRSLSRSLGCESDFLGRPSAEVASAGLDASPQASRLTAASKNFPSADRVQVAERVAGYVQSRLSAADLKSISVAFSEMGDDQDVLWRALASGAPVTAIASLAAQWPSLAEEVRAAIRTPLAAEPGRALFLDSTLVQINQTTCGASSLEVALILNDPFLAAWLATGRVFGDYVPVDVLRLDESVPTNTVERRWTQLQLQLHHQVTRHGLLGAPWPKAWGTPPWRLDNELRGYGVRYRAVMVDDAHTADMDDLWASVTFALADGLTVPLYTGGDSARGLDTAIPRHVVLAFALHEDGILLYEPGRGHVWKVRRSQFGQHEEGQPFFGGWNRLVYAVLPQTRRKDRLVP